MEENLRDLQRDGREQAEQAQKMRAELETLARQAAALERAAGGRRLSNVIDTTFSMEIGETVVVGTSHLRGGDKALIARLTAVPRGAKCSAPRPAGARPG